MPRTPLLRLFTYGTLMSTATGRAGLGERAAITACARLLGPASLRGALYDVGLYPAAVPRSAGTTRIHGEVWQVHSDHEDLLAMLDAYEGCAAHSSRPYPYQRIRIGVTTAASRRMSCAMYAWALSTDGLAVIESGQIGRAHV